MSALSILLLIKIVGTFFPVAAPLLVLPKERIDQLSGFQASDSTLYRLYGMALLALLVGYAGGFLEVQRGEFPAGVVVMGIVSNGGAFLVMLKTGRARQTPIAAGFFGLICIGLIASGLMAEAAVTPLW